MSDGLDGDGALARSAVTKATWRIIPLLGLGYLVAYMDRVNISFAALQMNDDLAFSATIYGLGAGFFYLAYALFEVPSNLLLTRFGARRWIARIMVTWGLLSAGMMFVHTPTHFYIMRFLLGMAEAGFFPGVVFYLASWYPRAHRGRATSRFYIAGPLASVVMGGISGWLLGLDGLANLQGWQWLFLVQGAPAVLVGFAILFLLPDAPETSTWLTGPEKDWIRRELTSDAERIGEPVEHSLFAALRNPMALQFGIIGFLTIGSMVTFTLSAPSLLKAATGMDSTHVGYLVGLGGIIGAAGMLFTGWISDRRGERFAPMLICTLLMAGSFLTIALATSPVVIMVAYIAFAVGWSSTTLAQVMAWPDVLHPRLLAIGAAAINTLSQIGAFIGPYAWGAAKDATGGYHAGLLGLTATAMLAAVFTVVLRRQVRR